MVAPRRHHPLGVAVLSFALAALSGCAELGNLLQGREPSESAAAVRESSQPDKRPAAPVSTASAALITRYASLESDFIAKDLLRTDSGHDVPFDADDLAAIFVKLATYAEYSPASGQIVARETAIPLRRWREPVRIGFQFGRSVSQSQRERDRGAVTALAQRLTNITGHPINTGKTPENMIIYVMNEDERRAALPALRQNEPNLTPAVLRALDHLAPTEFCAVVGIYDDGNPDILVRSLVFVRAEHPPLLRLSCFHEEIAQGLGLPNDSPAARPSVFNDDEEFALLTRMDEMLLRMLYDPRLRPGMSGREVAPVARTIAQELLNDTDAPLRASREET